MLNSDQFGIQESLKRLGIQSDNLGVSTGSKWIDSEASLIASFFPCRWQRNRERKTRKQRDF